MMIENININIVGTTKYNNDYLDKLSGYEVRSYKNVYSKTPLGCKHLFRSHFFLKFNNYLIEKL
jgi:hypothetical protein